MEKKQKADGKIQAATEKAKKDALNKLPPEEFMKKLSLEDNTTLKYSKFDETTCLPTHMHNGDELNKNQLKKAKKEFEGQRKKHKKN